MHSKQSKLESPQRLNELKPEETLMRIGLTKEQSVCDIGAGSGIFTVAAARLTDKEVFALELCDDMLKIISEKAKALGAVNIKTVKSESNDLCLPFNSVDLALMVTVLHEIQDKPSFIARVKEVLKENGRLAVIEFHKRQTPMGPPVSCRLGSEEVTEILEDAGFANIKSFDLGENFYCIVFKV